MNAAPERGGFSRIQLLAILWAILIFVLSSIPASSFPKFPIQVPDKLVHGTIFFVFCYFVYRALREQERFRRLASFSLPLSLLLTAVYGVLDELHQLYVPGRTADIGDFLADFVGGSLFVIIHMILRTRRGH